MAGRIPDNFIQELLARLDIVEVVGARLELKRAGREYKARSPFTDEKTPSFFVSPAKQMYFDFSSGKSGNALGFVMDFDRLGFVDAIELLASRAGLEVPREGGAVLSPEIEGAREALEQAANRYRAELRRNAAAQRYMEGRGITAATAERFGIGYAPALWDFISAKASDSSGLLAAGLVKRRDKDGDGGGHNGAGTGAGGGARGSGCYDVFRNRLMFPIRDTRGRVIAFGGRSLGDDPAKYLNSPETAVFHKGRNLFGLYEARQAGAAAPTELIVVEGYVDVVMLAQHGFSNVVAALGTATTREQVALLFRSAPRALFCFDGDRAGRAAAHRVLDTVLPELRAGRECRFVFLPEGEDPDSLVQAEGHAAFSTRLQAAQPLSEFLLAGLVSGCDLATVEGRTRLIAQARAPLAKLQDSALRTGLTAALAERTHWPYEEVQRQLQAGAARAPSATAESRLAGEDTDQPGGAARATVKSRSLRRALQLLGEQPLLAGRVQDLRQLAFAPTRGITELVEALEFFADSPHTSLGQLLEHWRQSGGRPALADIWSDPLPDMDESALTAEFDAAIAQLRHRALRARYKLLLEQADRNGLDAAAASELQALTRQLTAN